ncbi:MAG: SDR family oxidoreductase [Rhodospirillales bacterium]|nr:SDR family oxidoreductase [Rhodospirillales bacterium]
MGRMEGKIAIVTGAGAGIGESISKHFAREGAAVVCNDINEEAVNATVTEIEAAGGRAVAFAADVAPESSAIKMVELAQENFGGLTCIVNNAVHDLTFGPMTEVTLEDWKRTFDVNLHSAFLLSKHAIPVMAAGGGGSIIHVASQLGGVARPGRVWYCAAKGALINMAKAMALDFADQNIRVNSLSPGPVETGRYVKNFKDAEEARRNNFTLFNRLGHPDEIATGAVFLASDESSFMTGADLLIDGGFTAV